MQLSKDQLKAAKKILLWYFKEKTPQIITLGGYAGTGKTTLISVIKNAIDTKSDPKPKVAFCSYTGKAVQNLKNNLEEMGAIQKKDTISTIHGLIYKPIENTRGVITGWLKKDEIDADLIIVDEASMIDEEIYHDLLSFNVPIIAVGDHGQLPPIRGNFNLMERPNIVLEEIHRQVKDSPIISVSVHARKTGSIPAKRYGEFVEKYSTEGIDFHETSTELLQNYTPETLILCGYNTTRNKINQFVRNALGFETQEPQPQDRVICLRNNHQKGIYNGMLGTILEIRHTNEKFYDVVIEMDDSKTCYEGKIYADQFGATEPINFTKDRKKAKDLDLFDFGYALTVHKSQGSQAPRVILFEERFAKMDDLQWKRWLYTGVTRAERELFVFGS